MTDLDREKLLRIAREELQKHTFETFVDHPPSVAQGGRGVVVPGCPSCKKQLQSVNQFMAHLTDDVLPRIVERVATE